MTITVSEDLNATPRNPMRFCATVEDDNDPERGGFGATEYAALASLALQFNQLATAFLAGATIERTATR